MDHFINGATRSFNLLPALAAFDARRPPSFLWKTQKASLVRFPPVSSALNAFPTPATAPFRRARSLSSGRVCFLTDIARRENTAPRYVERRSRLAFAALRIVEAICYGRRPAELNAQTLLSPIDLPLEWSAQLDALGID